MYMTRKNLRMRVCDRSAQRSCLIGRQICQKRPINETYVFEKRHIYLKRDLCVRKETFVFEKRPMYMARKVSGCDCVVGARGAAVKREDQNVKRNPFQTPMYMEKVHAKKSYVYERDLHT